MSLPGPVVAAAVGFDTTSSSPLPSSLAPPEVFLVDPALAESMAEVIKGMKK